MEKKGRETSPFTLLSSLVTGSDDLGMEQGIPAFRQHRTSVDPPDCLCNNPTRASFHSDYERGGGGSVAH